MSNETLEKVIRTTEVYGGLGGLLNAEQSNRFIDYMWDDTALVRTAREIRMRADTVDIDKVGVGQKLLRVATEATDDGVNAGATFTKVSITTKKFRLDWEISTESLEDNIEGAGLEDHLARLMATQAGRDIEDIAINGDTALTGDALYKGFDGWKKLALNGAHVVSGAGATVSKATWNNAIKAMPRKYKARRSELRFYTGPSIIQDWIYALTVLDSSTTGFPETFAEGVYRGNPAVAGAAGGTYPFAFGIPVVEVPAFKEDLSGTYSGASGYHGYVELTFPNNRIVGIKRDIQVYRQFSQKKDSIEYTVYLRTGVQIENLDAYVYVKDVKFAA
jgi:HK97 family phage major capsid protein